MPTKTFPIVAIIAAVVLGGTAGLTAIATGDDSEKPGVSPLSYLHRLGQRLHGGGHHHDPMAELFDRLALTPDQRRRIENFHDVLGARGSQASASRIELHERLLAQFEQGQIETEEIRQVIDEHVEQFRETAYAATDELIELANGLDASQRQAVLEHFQEAGRTHHGHGH